MGKSLKISDAVVLKAEYELKEFQKEDSAYEIIYVILLDECYDDFTRGFLMAKLEDWSDSMDGKELLEEFIHFINLVREQ